MATLTVRNLPYEIHRALRARAARHGRITEDEVRDILAMAVMPSSRLRLGDALSDMSRKIGLANDDVEQLQLQNDKTPDALLRIASG